MKKIFTLIVIINIIGIIIGCGTGARETTIVNNSIEKDRLEIIKEKGVITAAGPPKEIPFFYKAWNKWDKWNWCRYHKWNCKAAWN